jgi:hypothetical protein
MLVKRRRWVKEKEEEYVAGKGKVDDDRLGRRVFFSINGPS